MKYTLRKPKLQSTLKNHHVFETTPASEGKCTSNTHSICRLAHRDQTDCVSGSTCTSEDAIRRKAAEIGREVCGVCMAEMYGDDDK